MFMLPTALVRSAGAYRHLLFGAAAAAAIIPMLTIPAAAAAATDRDHDDEGHVTGHFERTLSVKGPVDLNVGTGSGSISVQPGGDGSVHVVAQIRASRWSGGRDASARIQTIEKNPPIEQTGNQIRIGDTHDDRLYDNISISYQITVPANTTLRSGSGSGSQEIGGLTGPVHVSSGSGAVRIGATGGTVKAGTGSGSIVVEGAKERVEASTGSGSITLRQIAGSAKAGSGSGTIELEQTAKGTVELSTASGEVRVRGANGGAVTIGTASGSIRISGTPDAAWTLSSSSGSISLDLPSGSAFTLDARTTSGGIDVDHPVTVNSIRGRRREIRGAINGGGPTVSVETTSGSIHVGAR